MERLNGGNEADGVVVEVTSMSGPGEETAAFLSLPVVARVIRQNLLVQDGFRQVARLVHVDPGLNGQLVSQQLQRNDLQHGG